MAVNEVKGVGFTIAGLQVVIRLKLHLCIIQHELIIWQPFPQQQPHVREVNICMEEEENRPYYINHTRPFS